MKRSDIQKCPLCGKKKSQLNGREFTKHHISYIPERYIFACGSCHMEIHRGDLYSRLEPTLDSRYSRFSVFEQVGVVKLEKSEKEIPVYGAPTRDNLSDTLTSVVRDKKHKIADLDKKIKKMRQKLEKMQEKERMLKRKEEKIREKTQKLKEREEALEKKEKMLEEDIRLGKKIYQREKQKEFKKLEEKYPHLFTRIS